MIEIVFGLIGILVLLAIFGAIGFGVFALAKKLFGLDIKKSDADKTQLCDLRVIPKSCLKNTIYSVM